MLSLQFPNPSIVIGKEYWAYDPANLIADVGGLLGMLLGTSALSGLDYIMEHCSKACKWIGKP